MPGPADFPRAQGLVRPDKGQHSNPGGRGGRVLRRTRAVQEVGGPPADKFFLHTVFLNEK